MKVSALVKHCYLAPGGGCEVLFSPGLSVGLSVCVSDYLCVCPANILVFYFSAIRRDIDPKCIQDTYILYQCARLGDDRRSFNVIFDVCDD